MRSKFWVWLLLAAATLLIAWNTDIFVPVEHWLVSLAGHPEIQNQFNDPDYGRVDALTLLLSVFVLSPFAALLIIAAFTFALIIAALLIEPVPPGCNMSRRLFPISSPDSDIFKFSISS